MFFISSTKIPYRFFLCAISIYIPFSFSSVPQNTYDFPFLKEPVPVDHHAIENLAEVHGRKIIDFLADTPASEKQDKIVKEIFKFYDATFIFYVAAQHHEYFFEKRKDIKETLGRLVGEHLPHGKFIGKYPYLLNPNLFGRGGGGKFFKGKLLEGGTNQADNQFGQLYKSGIFSVYEELMQCSFFCNNLKVSLIAYLTTGFYQKNFENIKSLLCSSPDGCLFANKIHTVLGYVIKKRAAELITPDDNTHKDSQRKKNSDECHNRLSEAIDLYYSTFEHYWQTNNLFIKRINLIQEDYLKEECTGLFVPDNLFFIGKYISFEEKNEKENDFQTKMIKIYELLDEEQNNLPCFFAGKLRDVLNNSDPKKDALESVEQKAEHVQKIIKMLEIWNKRKVSFLVRNKDGESAADILAQTCSNILLKVINPSPKDVDLKSVSPEVVKSLLKILSEIDPEIKDENDYKTLEKIYNAFNFIEEIELAYSLKEYREICNKHPDPIPPPEKDKRTPEQIEAYNEAKNSIISRINKLREKRGVSMIPTPTQQQRETGTVEDLTKDYFHVSNNKWKSLPLGIEIIFFKEVNKLIENTGEVLQLVTNAANGYIEKPEDVCKAIRELSFFMPKENNEKQGLISICTKICEIKSEESFTAIKPLAKQLFYTMQTHMNDRLTIEYVKNLLNSCINLDNHQFINFLLKENVLPNETIEQVKASFSCSADKLWSKGKGPVFWALIKAGINITSEQFAPQGYGCLLRLLYATASTYKKDEMPKEFKILFEETLELFNKMANTITPYTKKSAGILFNFYTKWAHFLNECNPEVLKEEQKLQAKFPFPRNFSFIDLFTSKYGCRELHFLIMKKENENFNQQLLTFSREKFVEENKRLSFLYVALQHKNCEVFKEICAYRHRENIPLDAEEVKRLSKVTLFSISNNKNIKMEEAFEDKNFQTLFASFMQEHISKLDASPSTGPIENPFLLYVFKAQAKLNRTKAAEISEVQKQAAAHVDNAITVNNVEAYQSKPTPENTDIQKLSPRPSMSDASTKTEAGDQPFSQSPADQNLEQQEDKVVQIIHSPSLSNQKIKSPDSLTSTRNQEKKEQEKKHFVEASTQTETEDQPDPQPSATLAHPVEQAIDASPKRKQSTTLLTKPNKRRRKKFKLEIGKLSDPQLPAILETQAEQTARTPSSPINEEQHTPDASISDDKAATPQKKRLEISTFNQRQPIVFTAQVPPLTKKQIVDLANISTLGAFVSGALLLKVIGDPFFHSYSTIKEKFNKGSTAKEKLSLGCTEVWKAYKDKGLQTITSSLLSGSTLALFLMTKKFSDQCKFQYAIFSSSGGE